MGMPEDNGAFGESAYRIGADDILKIFVWKEPDLTTTVKVRPDGKIGMPVLGEMRAGGKTAAELQQEIAKTAGEYVVQPQVTVMVMEVNSPKVSVLGEVRRPNIFTLRKKITLLEAIAMAGGFTDFATHKQAVIIRNGATARQRIYLDLERLIFDSQSGPVYLQPSDQVQVE
jgi:polysaccharide export outer membrane protein